MRADEDHGHDADKDGDKPKPVAVSATPNPVAGTTTLLCVVTKNGEDNQAKDGDDGGDKKQKNEGRDDGDKNQGGKKLVYTWAALTTNPAPVVFSVNGSNATCTTVTFSRAGVYGFQVAVSGHGKKVRAGTVTVTVNQTPSSVSVTPPAATVNLNANTRFVAAVVDQFGLPMATQPVISWSVAGGGSIDQSGLFSAGTLPGGPFAVTATAGTIKGSAAVTVTDAPPVVTSFSIDANPVTGNTAKLTVRATDDGGEPSLIYSFTSTGPAAVIFSANGTNAAKDTVATFSKAGSYTVQASVKDAGNNIVTSSLNFTVSQTLTTILVTPATANLSLNAARTFAANAADQFGATMIVQPTFTWSATGGSIGAAGLYNSGANTGNFTVTAASAAVTGSAAVTVFDAPPTIATAAAASANPVSGTSVNLSVLAADDEGEGTLLYTWTANGPAPVTFSSNALNASKNTTVTFTQAGNYSFTATVTDKAGLTATSTTSLSVAQTLTSFDLSPSNVTINIGSTLQYSALARDQFGAALTTAPAVAWAVTGGGTIGASGLFSANSGGTFNVTVSSGAISQSTKVSVNLPPTVSAGADQIVTLPVNSATLNGTASDDGLPNPPGALTLSWSKVSGPGNVIFANAAQAVTTATFDLSGVYVLRLTANDSLAQASSDVKITVNQPPVVNAGPSQIVNVPVNSVTLTGTATDDGLPNPPGALTISWSKVSGPGTVTFGNAGALSTTATFSSSGLYVLRLSASDSVATSTSDISITVNQPPVVSAGADQLINMPVTTATLNGSASDDGLPNPPGALTLAWSKVSGPGAVTFANAAQAVTSANLALPGVYVLRLTASDGAASSSADVKVSINRAPVVSAGPNQSITLPAGAVLIGMASDDGLPNPPGALTISWTKVSGSGTVAFANPALASTTATFSAAGTYVLRLTASDSALSTSSDVSILVQAANSPPWVLLPAGADPNPLSGNTTTVSVLGADQAGEAGLTYTWAAIGTPPAPPVFAANGTNAAKTTTVNFTAPGIYFLQATITNASSLSVTTSTAISVGFGATVVMSSPFLGVPQAGRAAFAVTLSTPPPGLLKVALSAAGSSNISISPSTPETAFSPTDWNVPHLIWVLASSDPAGVMNTATITATAPGYSSGNIDVTSVPSNLPPNISPLAPPEVFDVNAFYNVQARDVTGYIAIPIFTQYAAIYSTNAVPGRIWQDASIPPAAVPLPPVIVSPNPAILRASGSRFLSVSSSGTIPLDVIGAPMIPVTFYCTGMGSFAENAKNTITVTTDKNGKATATFLAPIAGRIPILTSSPLSSGQVRFVIDVGH